MVSEGRSRFACPVVVGEEVGDDPGGLGSVPFSF